jgi:hypothetical protein
MGFTVTVLPAAEPEGYLVTVKVRLTAAESSSLFLSGDTLLSWPPAQSWGEMPATPGGEAAGAPGGAAHVYAGLTRERTSIFVSEAAGLAQGLQIRYLHEADAERAARLFRLQLLEAGIEEEE